MPGFAHGFCENHGIADERQPQAAQSTAKIVRFRTIIIVSFLDFGGLKVVVIDASEQPYLTVRGVQIHPVAARQHFCPDPFSGVE